MEDKKQFQPYIPANKVTPELTVTSIIMGILLAFLIVISTMLVNRTSEVKQLEEKNEELYQIVEKIQSNQNT